MSKKRGTNEDDLLNAALEAELFQVTEKKKKKLAQAKTKTKGKKKKKAWEDDEDDVESEVEEGEASDGDYEKPTPKKSAAVPLKKRKVADEPAADASDDSAELDDGYGSDLMGDEEDRRKLAAMTEIDRENALTERFEKRKALQERREARRKAKGGDGKKSAKDTRREKLRASVGGAKGKTASALDAYKRAKSAATRGDKVPLTPSRDDGGREEDESSSEEAPTPAKEKPEKKAPSRPAIPLAERLSVDEMNASRVTRLQLEKWLDQPYFERSLAGLYVRVGIGVSKLINERVYRCCEIVEVREGPRSYSLGGKKTNKTLLVKHGAAEKAFTMDVISNTPFTESEIHRWMRELAKGSLALPSKDELKELKEKLETLRNYVYTDADINEMVEIRDKARVRPISIARRKAQLLSQRISKINLSEPVEEIDRELKELEIMAKEAALAEQERITNIERINVKNREREQSIADAARIENRVQQEQQAKAAATGDLNPFSRRPTAPSLMYVPKAEVDAMMKRKKEGIPEPTKAAQPPPGFDKDKMRASVDEGDEDVLLKERESLRVSLDINLDPKLAVKAAIPPPRPLSAVQATPVTDAPKKTLSLAEYRRRMGLS